tara:strand:- start:546 stop:947 length:402 start_codon:yes stop_codon:yes gene_type:complete
MEWNKTENANDEKEFLPYRQMMKSDGEFHFSFTGVSHNENAGSNGESECITLFDDETDTAVTMWCKSHVASLYPVEDSKTDGAKLGRALQRSFSGESWSEVMSNASAGGKLSVTKNAYEASPTGFAWLFVVVA